MSKEKVIRQTNLQNTKIHSGISVQGIDLEGMTKEEAKDQLAETFEVNIGSKKLPILIEDKQYELIYSDIIPKYNIDEEIEEAYNFGKQNGI